MRIYFLVYEALRVGFASQGTYKKVDSKIFNYNWFQHIVLCNALHGTYYSLPDKLPK